MGFDQMSACFCVCSMQLSILVTKTLKRADKRAVCFLLYLYILLL